MKQCWFVLLALSACAFQQRRNVESVGECGAATTPGATLAMDSAQIASLTGRFRLVQVISSLKAGRAPHIWLESSFALAPPTAEKLTASRRRGVGHYPRANLRLVGRWELSGLPQPDQAELDGNVVFLGCRDCTDASPTKLDIEGCPPTTCGVGGTTTRRASESPSIP